MKITKDTPVLRAEFTIDPDAEEMAFQAGIVAVDGLPPGLAVMMLLQAARSIIEQAEPDKWGEANMAIPLTEANANGSVSDLLAEGLAIQHGGTTCPDVIPDNFLTES